MLALGAERRLLFANCLRFRFLVVFLVPRRKSPRPSMGWKAMIYKAYSNPNWLEFHGSVTPNQGHKDRKSLGLPVRMAEPRAVGTAPSCGERIQSWRLWREQIQLWHLALIFLLKDLNCNCQALCFPTDF